MENDADKFDFVRPLVAENDPVAPVGNGIAAADIVPVKGTDKRELIPVKQTIDIDSPKRERGGIQKHALDFLKRMGVAFSIASALTSSPSVDRFHRDMNAPARRNHAGDEEAWENVRFGRRKQEVEDSSDGLQLAIPHYEHGGAVAPKSSVSDSIAVDPAVAGPAERVEPAIPIVSGRPGRLDSSVTGSGIDAPRIDPDADSDSGVFGKIKSISDRLSSGVKNAASITSKAAKRTATVFSIASALSGWGDLSPVVANVAAASGSNIPREVQIGSHWLDHDRRRKAVESKDHPKVVGKSGESIDDHVMHYDKGGQVAGDSDSGVFRKIKSISSSLGSGVKSAAETASKAVKKTATVFSIASALSGWGDMSSVAASASASADSSTPREVAMATHWLGHDRRRRSAETKESPKASGKASDGIDDPVDHYDKGGPVVTGLVPAKSRTADSADQVSDDGGADGGFQNDAHRDWFGNSKITDESGKPLTLHHGTTSDFDVFDTSRSQLGSHFGTRSQAEGFAKGKDNGRIHDVTLRMENPLRLRDHGRWYWPDVTQELKEKGIDVPDELEKEYQAVTKENLFERIFRGITGSQLPSKRESIAKWTTKNLQDVIKKSGHDGVVYRNDFEGLDTAKFQEARKERGFQYGSQEYEDALKEFGASDSYIVFDPTQIKATSNKTFDPNSPSIHKADGGEIDRFKVGGSDEGEGTVGDEWKNVEGEIPIHPDIPADADEVPIKAKAGDFVVRKESSQKFKPVLEAIKNDSIQPLASRSGGDADGAAFYPLSSDYADNVVPIKATAGEFIVPRQQARKHKPLLEAINNDGNQTASEVGDSDHFRRGGEIKSFDDFESDVSHLPPRVREKAFAHYVAQQSERGSLPSDFAKKELRDNTPENITQYNHAKKERESGFYEAREKWNEQHETRRLDKITQEIEKAAPQALDDVVSAIKRNELSTSEIVHRYLPEGFRNGSSSDWVSHLRTSIRRADDDAHAPISKQSFAGPLRSESLIAKKDNDLARIEKTDTFNVPMEENTPATTTLIRDSRDVAERESAALRASRGMADSGYSVSSSGPAAMQEQSVIHSSGQSLDSLVREQAQPTDDWRAEPMVTGDKVDAHMTKPASPKAETEQEKMARWRQESIEKAARLHAENPDRYDVYSPAKQQESTTAPATITVGESSVPKPNAENESVGLNPSRSSVPVVRETGPRFAAHAAVDGGDTVQDSVGDQSEPMPRKGTLTASGIIPRVLSEPDGGWFGETADSPVNRSDSSDDFSGVGGWFGKDDHGLVPQSKKAQGPREMARDEFSANAIPAGIPPVSLVPTPTSASAMGTDVRPRAPIVPTGRPDASSTTRTEPGIDSPIANRSLNIAPNSPQAASSNETPTSIQATTGRAVADMPGKDDLPSTQPSRLGRSSVVTPFPLPTPSSPSHASDAPVKNTTSTRGQKEGSGWVLSDHPELQSSMIDAIRSGKSPSEVHAMIPANLRSSSTPALVKQMFMMNGGAESPRLAVEEPRRGESPEPPAQSGENPSLSTDVKPAAPSLPSETTPAKSSQTPPVDDWRSEWRRANAARPPVQDQGGMSFADLQRKRKDEEVKSLYEQASENRARKEAERNNQADQFAVHKATPQQSDAINSRIATGKPVAADVLDYIEPAPKKSPARGSGGYDSPKKPGEDAAAKAAKDELDATIARLNKSREAERDAENKRRLFDTKSAIAKESGAVDYDDHFESVRGELNKVIDNVGQQPPLASGKKRYFHGGQKIDAGDDHMFDVFTPSVEEAAYAAMLAEKPVSYIDLDEKKAQNLSRNYHADPSVTQSSTVLFDTFDAKKKRDDDTPVARERFTPTTPQEPLPSLAESRSSVADDADVPTALRADGTPGDSAPIATEAKTPAKREATPRAKRKGGRAETASESASQGPAGDTKAIGDEIHAGMPDTPQSQQPKRPVKTMIASGGGSVGSTRDDDASIPTALRADGVVADFAPIATAAPATAPTATPAPGEKPKATTKNTPANMSETDRLSWKMNQRFDLSQRLHAGGFVTDMIGGGGKSKSPFGWNEDFYHAVYGKEMPRSEGIMGSASGYLRRGANLASSGALDSMFGKTGSTGIEGMIGGLKGGLKDGFKGDGEGLGKIAMTAAKFAFPEASPLIAIAEKFGIGKKISDMFGGKKNDEAEEGSSVEEEQAPSKTESESPVEEKPKTAGRGSYHEAMVDNSDRMKRGGGISATDFGKSRNVGVEKVHHGKGGGVDLTEAKTAKRESAPHTPGKKDAGNLAINIAKGTSPETDVVAKIGGLVSGGDSDPKSGGGLGGSLGRLLGGGGEDDPRQGGERGSGDDGTGKMVGKIATTAAKFAFPEAAPLIAMAEKTGIVDKLFSSEGSGMFGGGGSLGTLGGLLGGGDGKDGRDGKDESGGGEVAKLLRELIDIIKGQGKAGEQSTGYGNTQSHPSLNLSIPGLINAIGLMANAPRG